MTAQKPPSHAREFVVAAVNDRLDLVVRSLRGPERARLESSAASSAAELEERLVALLAVLEPAEHWFLAAVVTATLPHALFVDEITRAVDLADFDRAAGLLIAAADPGDSRALPLVRVVEDTVLLDVHGLHDTFALGDSRRVAEEIRASAPADVLRVTWSQGFTALVEARETPGTAAPDVDTALTVIVPLRGAYLLPDVCDQPARASKVMSLASGSSTSTISLGYGLGPLLDVELYDKWPDEPADDPRRFSWHLAASRVMDRVVTVSTTAFRELAGWKSMLPAVGVPGPTIIEGALGLDAVQIGPAAARPRILLAGTDPVTADFDTLAQALSLVGASTGSAAGVSSSLDPDELSAVGEGLEVVRVAPPAATSESDVDPFARAAVVVHDTTLSVRASDIVVSVSPYSSHDVAVESLLAAGLRGVVARTGFGEELRARWSCVIVPPRDELALADAIAAVSERAVPPPTVTVAAWREFTDLVWSSVDSL